MKTEVTSEFRVKVKKQIRYISLDKTNAAKNFRKLIFSEIDKIKEMPLKIRNQNFLWMKTSENLSLKVIPLFMKLIKNKIKL